MCTLPKFTSVKCCFALLLSLFIVACSSEVEHTPEQAVEAVLTSMELAAEKRSLSEFMQHVSGEYRDHQGQLKEDIQRLVQFQYIRNQKIHILTDIKKIDIEDNIATVELNAAMAARATDLEGSSVGMRANTHSFSILLHTEDDQRTWKVVSVSWQRGWQ